MHPKHTSHKHFKHTDPLSHFGHYCVWERHGTGLIHITPFPTAGKSHACMVGSLMWFISSCHCSAGVAKDPNVASSQIDTLHDKGGCWMSKEEWWAHPLLKDIEGQLMHWASLKRHCFVDCYCLLLLLFCYQMVVILVFFVVQLPDEIKGLSLLSLFTCVVHLIHSSDQSGRGGLCVWSVCVMCVLGALWHYWCHSNGNWISFIPMYDNL